VVEEEENVGVRTTAPTEQAEQAQTTAPSLPFTGGGETAFAIATIAAGGGYILRRIALKK